MERISDIFEMPFDVIEDDIDAMNHVNNLVYLKWSNRAAGAHTKEVGWTRENLIERGAVFMVRTHDITYRKQALLGDGIEAVIAAIYLDAGFSMLDVWILLVLACFGVLIGLLPAIQGLRTPVAENLHPTE